MHSPIQHPFITPYLLTCLAGSGTTPDGSEAGEAGAGLAALSEEDRSLIRQELFLGHLLTLVGASGAVPPHALPSIAAHLQTGGLIPKWLAFTLTQQPALFDRAFSRVFHQVGGCWWVLVGGLLVGGLLVAKAGGSKLAGGCRHACLPSCPNPRAR